MKRIFKKSKNYREAEEWDILQHTRMTPEERQEAAAELRRRVYGAERPDVREAHRQKENSAKMISYE
jgi:hypothetical protein